MEGAPWAIVRAKAKRLKCRKACALASLALSLSPFEHLPLSKDKVREAERMVVWNPLHDGYRPSKAKD